MFKNAKKKGNKGNEQVASLSETHLQPRVPAMLVRGVWSIHRNHGSTPVLARMRTQMSRNVTQDFLVVSKLLLQAHVPPLMEEYLGANNVIMESVHQ